MTVTCSTCRSPGAARGAVNELWAAGGGGEGGFGHPAEAFGTVGGADVAVEEAERATLALVVAVAVTESGIGIEGLPGSVGTLTRRSLVPAAKWSVVAPPRWKPGTL